MTIDSPRITHSSNAAPADIHTAQGLSQRPCLYRWGLDLPIRSLVRCPPASGHRIAVREGRARTRAARGCRFLTRKCRRRRRAGVTRRVIPPTRVGVRRRTPHRRLLLRLAQRTRPHSVPRRVSPTPPATRPLCTARAHRTQVRCPSARPVRRARIGSGTVRVGRMRNDQGPTPILRFHTPARGCPSPRPTRLPLSHHPAAAMTRRKREEEDKRREEDKEWKGWNGGWGGWAWGRIVSLFFELNVGEGGMGCGKGRCWCAGAGDARTRKGANSNLEMAMLVALDEGVEMLVRRSTVRMRICTTGDA
ncbi:hypothetical protein DFH09DRAFT_156782 [Mycena vulgaris]|nr:hypothetical protein DFH09DRAFT_156782 [Mycena vulgaris]